VTDADRNRLTAELDFGRVPEYMATFPFPHTVRYSASIEGITLTIALGVRATGEVDVPISFGFHPYLTLPGSDRRGWQVQIPVAKQAVMDERMLPTGETVEVSAGELDGALDDRTFDTSYPVVRGDQPEFVVADDRRRLALRHVTGYPVTQVYAPEASQFICFEPMTAPVDALISGDGLRWVKPGQDFEAVFSISAERA
jgi:galactose mutarotase-like enzyme